MSLWMNFWEVIWWFVAVFAFVAYLMVVFNIVADLFRDHALNGWWKALWIFLLVFVPVLTALVYLIARGDGMAQRTSDAAHAQQNAADSYIRSVAASSPSEEIDKASKLLAAGVITPQEFASIKAQVLR